ncbi:MAG TPA: M56 family metallopeptidase [Gemmatimonadaceae bacterium]|nr:M56 family metallopeptidase [Gemmatimonadaceae bacterium]
MTFDSTSAAVATEVLLKGTLLIAAVSASMLTLRGATASMRHLLWSFTLVALLAIPALTLVLPRWNLGVLPTISSQKPVAVGSPAVPMIDRTLSLKEASDQPAEVTREPASAAVASNRSIHAPHNERSPLDSLALIWIGGLAAGLIAIAGGILTLRRFASNATLVESDEWNRLAKNVADELGLSRRVRLFSSRAAVMPATWGVIRPVVVLPAGANGWDDDRRRVVLLHEFAHIKRNDCLTQIVAQLCCAVYWFHPGVWYTARKLRSERELACDEQVIDIGVNAFDYAEHLLDIARTCRAPAAPAIAAAVAMARPSQLEGRLQAILAEIPVGRWQPTRFARSLTVALLALAIVPLSAMRPWRDASTNEGPPDTFRWKGIVPGGQWVELLAAYGDMRAELSNSNEVEIIAVRKSGDRNAYQIAMENGTNGPQFCVIAAATKAERPCETDRATLKHGVPDIRVDFLVKVPAGVGVSAHVDRGNIAVEGVKSYVWGTSDRGDISIVTSDLAEASTRIGSISAEFGRRSWKQDLEFFTEKGDVTVVAPSDANMLVQMETGDGQIKSEFSSEKNKWKGKQRSTGSVGQGGGMLTIRTGRGIVELKRGAKATADVSDMPVSYSNAPLVSPDPKPNPNPDPDPGYNPNPVPSYNPNPNPSYNPNPNPDEQGEYQNLPEDDPTGERVRVVIPDDLLSRFTDQKIQGMRDKALIARFRNTVTEHVKQHPADLVKERSEWALTLVRNGMLMNALKESLTAPDWRVRAYAAWALGESRDKEATDALRAALKDENWRVRMHAAAGLQRIAGSSEVDPLISLLLDDYWQVRISAVDALASIGDRRALPSLRQVAQTDPRSIVRDQALNAIQRLK